MARKARIDDDSPEVATAAPANGDDADLPWEKTPEGRLYAEVARASSYPALARLFNEKLNLDQAAIARGAGLQPSTISRWLDARAPTEDVRKPGRLDDLRYVVLSLLTSRTVTVDILSFWLKLDRDHILGTGPLKAIADGRFVDVVEAGLELTNPAGPQSPAEKEIRKRLELVRAELANELAKASQAA